MDDIKAAGYNKVYKMSIIHEHKKKKKTRKLDALKRFTGTCGWEDVVNKYENRLFGTKFDTFSYDIHKLPNSEVCWNQIPANFQVQEFSGTER